MLPSQRRLRAGQSRVRAKTITVFRCNRCRALWDNVPKVGGLYRCPTCQCDVFTKVRVAD